MKKSGILITLVLILSFGVSAQFPGMESINPVSWDYSMKKLEEGKYELNITATIESPWHMYAIKQEKAGPIPTNFTFNETPGVEIIGEIQEISDPVIKFDEGFQFDIGAYYDKAAFKQIVKITGDSNATLTGSVEYQCCDDETCLPPFRDDFSFELEAPLTAADEKAIPLENREEKDGEKIIKTDETDETEPEALQKEQTENLFTEDETTEEKLTSGPAVVGDEGGKRSDRSMAGFLIITFLLGLAAILTPCVYPMIPMTISFFMRGDQKKSLTVIKGIVFGLSMILVYTGLGVLVALTGLDANFGNVISTHWIPNIIFFTLFMIFAASFLGMFEFVMPSGLVNKVDKQAEKGGLIGPFFMGITTVLVSFSCTGPIVGSLLTEAAGGEVMKPILGMFFFSLAFALPFTFLAISPSMLKSLPKSGGWLNSVKVVLGFMMFAFGLKFLSSMDQAYHLNIFTREIYLAIWFVTAVLVGFYLLGKIRFPHDSELKHISVPRLMLSMASFVFAVYLLTGIFGNDLNAISSVIPPKSAQSFQIGGISTSAGSEDQYDQSGSYCGPGKHNDILHLPYGIKGYFDYNEGLDCAREKSKPVFLDFTGHSCSNCKQMEAQVWSDPRVLQRLKEEFVVVSLYTDDKTKLPESEWIETDDGKVLKTIGEVNVYLELTKFNTFATPWYVLLDEEGNLLNEPIGKEMNVEEFINFLDEGIDAF